MSPQLTWNVGVGRMVMRVGSLQLGPSWTLAHHHVVCLATPFRLQGQQSPVGGRLAGAHLLERLASFDLRVDLGDGVR